MAGGEGSRLRPLTSRHPKPLVPVVGLPVIEHILRLLRLHGIKQVVVTLAYLGAEIRNRLGDGTDLDMEIEYVVEDRPLGTAGSVRNAAHLLDDTFLVISGDAMTDLNLTAAVEEHRRRQSAATIVLHQVPNPLEYGVIVTDDAGNVVRFLEKPSWGEVFSDQANTGIYVLDPEVLQYMEPHQNADWSQDVFPAMLARGAPLRGFVTEDYWCDIGSIASYLQANWDALEGRVRCHIPGRREGQVWLGEGVEFGMGVHIDGPAFIGDEVKLKGGAWLNDRVIVDRFAIVDEHSKISNSIIWPHTYIGESCRLRQTILCRNVTMKNNVFVEENTVIGDECAVGRGSRIRAGVKVWPNKEIEPGSTVNDSVIWAGEWRRGVFASYGMSGLINVELTPEFCARLGAAFGAMLPKGSDVAVGRDHARSSRMIKRAIVSGIVSAGGNVRDVHEPPVPVIQFATRQTGCDAGVQVVVSPLDQRSADIRFLDADGLQIDKRTERKLENLLFREDFRRAAFYEMGDIEYHDPIPAYRAHLLASVNVDAIREAGLRLLVDYDYSEASSVLPAVLSELGVTTIPLNAGLHEGPHHRAVPMETALISRTVNADLGCMLGPTGERLALIDETGTVLSSQETFGVIASWFLPGNPGIVLAPAATPDWIAQLVRDAGGTFSATAADAPAVVRAAATAGTCLAADGAGGFAWPQYLAAFDAMYTVVKMLELRALNGLSLREARESLPNTAYLTATEFCPWEAKGRVMRVLLDGHRNNAVDLVDGIKVFVDDGFVLVRPDPDEPAYHIVASVRDESEGRELVNRYAQLVRDAQTTNGRRELQEATV